MLGFGPIGAAPIGGQQQSSSSVTATGLATFGPFTVLGIAAQSDVTAAVVSIGPVAAVASAAQQDLSSGAVSLGTFSATVTALQEDRATAAPATGPFAALGIALQGNAISGVASVVIGAAITAAQSIAAAGAASVAVVAAVSGRLEDTASSSSAFGFHAVAQGGQSIAAVAAPSIALTAAGSGRLEFRAAGSALLPIAVSSVATQQIAGTGAAPFGFTAQVDAGQSIFASAAVDIGALFAVGRAANAQADQASGHAAIVLGATGRAAAYGPSNRRAIQLVPDRRAIQIPPDWGPPLGTLTTYTDEIDPKDPSDIDGLPFDLSPWLGPKDALAGVPQVTITPSDMTLTGITLADNVVTAWAAGGSAGNSPYTVSLYISTINGRSCRRSVLWPVQPR